MARRRSMGWLSLSPVALSLSEGSGFASVGTTVAPSSSCCACCLFFGGSNDDGQGCMLQQKSEK